MSLHKGPQGRVSRSRRCQISVFASAMGIAGAPFSRATRRRHAGSGRLHGNGGKGDAPRVTPAAERRRQNYTLRRRSIRLSRVLRPILRVLVSHGRRGETVTRWHQGAATERVRTQHLFCRVEVLLVYARHYRTSQVRRKPGANASEPC